MATLFGTDGNDTLDSAGYEYVRALGGNNLIDDGGGASLIDARSGNDTIAGLAGGYGGDDRDTIKGGTGSDILK